MSTTEFVVTKEQAIKKVSSSLVAKGYREDEVAKRQFIDRLRNLISGITTWNPDIFLVHKNGQLLVGDVQLPEERQAHYIPAAMEQAVPRITSNVGSVDVVLYIPMGGVPETHAIRNAAKLNICIEAIDQAGVIHRILEPSTVCNSSKANSEEKKAIESQRASGWFIPQVLVQKLSSLRNLEYSSQLQQFAADYFRAATPVRLSVQYKLASQCIENIIKSKYRLDLCCEPLRISKDLQRMARRKGESRDHFLHAFQTFLMGALILDNYAGSSNSPFVLCNRYPRMDLPWLLASIFHDFGFDLAHLESCLGITIGEFRYIPRGNLAYSNLLNSFYNYQKNDGDVDNWNPDTYSPNNSDLGRILFNAAIERSAKVTLERLRVNHGVLSAHEIISIEERLRSQMPGLLPTFASSALSASMHDKKLWAEMFSKSIFPVEASRFPLLYLLVLCDTLAEAGRPWTMKVEQKDAVLTRFDLENNVINYTVWFLEPERACTMNFWTHFVQERCFTHAPLSLDCNCLV